MAFSLRTLGKDDLFAYICVHAAGIFARLKWLADIAALLSKETPEEIERLFLAAKERGAGRAASVALLLAARFLGFKIPPSLFKRIDRGRAARRLAAHAVHVMAGGDGQTDFYKRRFVPAAISVFDFWKGLE